MWPVFTIKIKSGYSILGEIEADGETLGEALGDAEGDSLDEFG